jgi:hypothetical protein
VYNLAFKPRLTHCTNLTTLFPAIFNYQAVRDSSPLLGTLRTGSLWWSAVHWTRTRSGALLKLDATLVYKQNDVVRLHMAPDSGEFSMRYFPASNQLQIELLLQDQHQSRAHVPSTTQLEQEYAEVEQVYHAMIQRFGNNVRRQSPIPT